MPTKNNKVILRVKRDKKNSWFLFGKGRYRVQLAGDPRKGGYWLAQYADSTLGVEKANAFLTDFTKILSAMAEADAEIFSMYEMPEVLKPETGE